MFGSMKKILAMLLMLAMLACSVPVLADEAIPAAYCPHRWIIGETVYPATCQAEGVAQQVCAWCNAVSDDYIILSKTGHDYSTISSAPSCTRAGVYGTLCSVCGDELGTVVRVPALGHTPVKFEAVEADCENPGREAGESCSVCGAVVSGGEIIPAKGHELTVQLGKDATCTEPGLSIGEICAVCGEVFQPQTVIPAKGHELTVLMPKDPSCTEPGLTIGEVCAACGEIFQPQFEVPVTGHKPVAIPGKAASCTETGLTEGSKCSVCSAVITAQQTIPMTEHSYELSSNGKKYICEFCGDSLNAKPKDITINTKASIEVGMGDTLELDVIYSPAGSFSPVTWSSSNKKVISIDEDGVIEALKEGSATITAKTKNGRKDSIKIKVVDTYKPTKVELDQEGTIILGLGEELQLNAVLYPDTAETELEWDVNSSRCKVDEDGLVTTVRTGTATITVKTANGKRDSVKVRVVDPDEPYCVELSESNTIKLTVGEEFQLDAVVYPASADYELTWSSSSSRCEVDDDGLITAVREGSATITVRTQNGEKDTVKVRISD